jgi:Zn-dependent peptidase ImmA (M78 family)/transcriptional regulator with XRE-family HTH domain
VYHREVLTLTNDRLSLGPRLTAARERAGFTQDDVAVLLGQPRPVVSNWEHGTRRPNSAQLAKLAVIYRIPLDELIGRTQEHARPDFERLLFRDAGARLDPSAKFQIQRFLSFLDAYGHLLDAIGAAPGMMRSPLSLREGFLSKDDIRRKAEEARRFFRLGDGPVGDLWTLADLSGVTVYQAPLGTDLRGTVSGAFLPHDRVGFSIVVNSQTTPGRRQFTLAHELAHALFHGDHIYVGYLGRRKLAERFANEFAAEFLVPIQSLRSVVETLGLAKVEDAEVVVYLQRLFRVSYAMMLVRLEVANLSPDADIARLRGVQPVQLAQRLGYPIQADEWGQDPDRWGLGRFPPRFLQLLRRALAGQKITVGGAASMTGLAQEDIEEFLAERPTSPEEQEEFQYLRESA